MSQTYILVLQVMEKTLYISWHLADPGILINWIQFAAAKGKTDYVGLLLDHGYNNWQFGTEPKNVPVFDIYQLVHRELPFIFKTYWPAGGGRGQNPENTAQGHSGRCAPLVRPPGQPP